MKGGFFKPLMKPGLGVEIDEARVIELSKTRRTGEIRCGGMRMDLSPNGKCASYFALVMRWLHFTRSHTIVCSWMRKLPPFPSANYLAHRNIVINKNKTPSVNYRAW